MDSGGWGIRARHFPKWAAPVQPTGLPILSFEMIKAEGGYLVRMQKGVVVPPGTTAIRAPDIELKASFSSGDSVELRSVDSEIPAVPES